MAKTSERFSALKIVNLKGPGYFADGGNLYFRIAPGGARGWIFRFTMQGRVRDMGLGAYPEISLAAARRLAAECRELVKKGADPIEHRRSERADQRVAAAKSRTFDECARDYIEDHEAGWGNAKHRAQWASTLKRYASPVFGKLPVSEIDSGFVMRALKPIWETKTETASRLRGRIESVLDWARVNGFRSGENPARWKGNLKHLLPDPTDVRDVKHHAALPFDEIAGFMVALRARQDMAALALQFVIMTAARSGEALRACWDEIDLQRKTWTIPPERMKVGKEHRVPLSAAAIALLERLQEIRTSDFLFPGGKVDRPLSDMALLMLLRRMDRADLTVHGFRSTFRDWAAERTNYPNHVVEMALAHAIPSAVEAAYRRGELFEKRRRLLESWADFCASASAGDVVPMRRRATEFPPAGK
jgi:integrase